MITTDKINLTEFSHGYGCGCKIAPAVLDEILKGNESNQVDPLLLVGNEHRDDAAVYDLGNGSALVSTTDFFMPVVDDAFTFGQVAAANALSDIYAMGGTPLLAVAILGWPVDKLPASMAAEVIAGGRMICKEAGIPLAGGHSIDSPEPFFGLAANGLVAISSVKRNNTAREGDLLFITKPIGAGIITTAAKKKIAKAGDLEAAIFNMITLNKAGMTYGVDEHVHAMTDITGFGLFGHLIEMAEGSSLTAVIDWSKLPELPNLDFYLDQQCVPAITYRNWNSYGHKIQEPGVRELQIGCDPQTSGGLLIAVDPVKFNNSKGAGVYGNSSSLTLIGYLKKQSEKIIEFGAF